MDDPKVIEKKIKRAVTDSGDDVTYDPENRPGVANLLSILAAATDRDPKVVAQGYTQFGPLKADTAEALITLLAPIQSRYRELEADPAATRALLAQGADKAGARAAVVLARGSRRPRPPALGLSLSSRRRRTAGPDPARPGRSTRLRGGGAPGTRR